MRETKILELRWISTRLWEDQFEFVALPKNQFGAGFWAHADPIDAGGSHARPICFNCHLEPRFMQCFNEFFVELQQRLTTSAHNKPASWLRIRAWPFLSDCIRESPA